MLPGIDAAWCALSPNGYIIGANAVLNKSITTPNVMVAGIPAVVKGPWKPWWLGTQEEEKVNKIEELKRTKYRNEIS